MGVSTYFLGLNSTKRMCIDRSAHPEFKTAIGCLISCVAEIWSHKLIHFGHFLLFLFLKTDKKVMVELNNF